VASDGKVPLSIVSKKGIKLDGGDVLVERLSLLDRGVIYASPTLRKAVIAQVPLVDVMNTMIDASLLCESAWHRRRTCSILATFPSIERNP
jgi:hypothetical protein